MRVLISEGWVHVNQAKGEQGESTWVKHPHNGALLTSYHEHQVRSWEVCLHSNLFWSVSSTAQLLSFPPLAKYGECSKLPREKKCTWKHMGGHFPCDGDIIMGPAASFIGFKLTQGTKQESGFQEPGSFVQLFSANNAASLSKVWDTFPY